MRGKKNREVNIFSASVVDLFASGLGVFLIVSIIALVNQKKEMAKGGSGEFANSVAKQMEGEVLALSEKVKKLTNENFNLKAKNLEFSEKSSDELSKATLGSKIRLEQLKAEVKRKSEKISEMEIKVQESQKLVADLKEALDAAKRSSAQGTQGVATNFEQYNIGSKIRLENVHFYPGTDRGIEPYASREIRAFAVHMLQNPGMTVEVSGHIFETKKAIESGKAEDTYNLSGRRANYVCRKLVEFGVSLKRLTCTGYGATRPVFLTDDQYSEEAQLNRRVEIEILSK